MRIMICGCAFAILSACGGSTTSGLRTMDSNFNEASLVGQTFSGPAVTIRGNSTATATARAQLTSARTAEITVDETTTTYANYDGDGYTDLATGDRFVISTRLKGAAETRDVLFIIAEDRPPPFLAGQRTTLFVDGRNATLAELPTGSARYAGVAFGINPSAQTVSGQITLNVGFADDTLTGSLTGVNPSQRSATYAIANGRETDGSLFGTLTGTGVVGGVVNGNIYGRDADQAAGTFQVSIPGQSFVGMFAATGN